MNTLQRAKGDRVAICDSCYKMERPNGGWIPCRRASFPSALFVSDFCPTCCEQYVNFLLETEADEMEGEIVLPEVQRRKSRSRSVREPLETVRRTE